LRTIVELKTDDGITGIGETYGGEGPVTAREAFATASPAWPRFNWPGFMSN
jgi:L-alanine-DL-glutamate epimerase-like enolase superfamily enzyme